MHLAQKGKPINKWALKHASLRKHFIMKSL